MKPDIEKAGPVIGRKAVAVDPDAKERNLRGLRNSEGSASDLRESR